MFFLVKLTDFNFMGFITKSIHFFLRFLNVAFVNSYIGKNIYLILVVI